MANEKVLLVFAAKCPGGKGFFKRLREVGSGDRGAIPRTEIELDDDISQAASFDPAIALISRDRFRCEGRNVWIEDRRGTRLFERDRSEIPSETDSRRPQFVTFTNGLGLTVVPGNSPLGRCWFVRPIDVPFLLIDGRHTALESTSGDTPEQAAQRATELWGTDILFADPTAAAPKRQQSERKQIQPALTLRPGDRSI